MLTKENRIFQEILQFVYQQRGKYRKEPTKTTRLLEDLGIDGDDAVDFFDAFQEAFKVDLSTLDLSKYFNSEGSEVPLLTPLFRFVVHLLLGKFIGIPEGPFDKTTLVSITLGDLEQTVILGKWVDPE